MPWPDFTELSFGYCFLRELESRYTHAGQFPKAPDFISQHDEATKGYDVEVAINGAVPLFIQLKRSMVIRHPAAREFKSPFFATAPVCRMTLHAKHHYAQHLALQALDTSGAEVIYATSQIETPEELAWHVARGTVISSASAIFEPNEIALPNLTEAHHVSFYPGEPWAAVFSEEGKRFDRRFVTPEKWLAQLLDKPRNADRNRDAMRQVVRIIRERFNLYGSDFAIGRFMDDDPIVAASVLAYFVLGLQMTFVKPVSEPS